MDSREVETLVLRFRDLVTEAYGTIRLHREILQDRGYVWWGWWNKLGEKVPAEVFQALNARAREASGIEILMFDSGHEEVRRARAAEIFWTLDATPGASPELDATPAYYRDQRYLAWFKLIHIDEQPSPPDILTNYTYERVDSFFESGTSKYDAFYGKRVHSPQELRQQDRTIWFVRSGRSGDPSHEVFLLDAKAVSPSHFPEASIESESDTLLWLSDLHFSNDQHGFPLESTTTELDLAASLERDLKVLGVRDLAAVLISGDVTWRAGDGEFTMARNFVRGVQSWSKLPDYQVLVCPGNHDIRFSDDPGELDRPVSVAPEEARAAYSGFYENLYHLPPNRFLSSGRRFLLNRSFPVEVVALNSSLLDQTQDLFQGHGFLGDEQLEHAASEFGWREGEDSPGPFRIVMLHHHVVPVSYREIPKIGANYSVVLDAGALIRWATRHRVALILHGHMHQPLATRLFVPIRGEGQLESWHDIHILAMGSTGVAQQHLPDIGKNTFGLIRFARRGVSVEIYTIDRIRRREQSDPPHFSLVIPYSR